MAAEEVSRRGRLTGAPSQAAPACARERPPRGPSAGIMRLPRRGFAAARNDMVEEGCARLGMTQEGVETAAAS